MLLQWRSADARPKGVDCDQIAEAKIKPGRYTFLTVRRSIFFS